MFFLVHYDESASVNVRVRKTIVEHTKATARFSWSVDAAK